MIAYLEASWATSFLARVPSRSRVGLIYYCSGIFVQESEETHQRWHYYCPCEDFMYRIEGDRGAGDVCDHVDAARQAWAQEQSDYLARHG